MSQQVCSDMLQDAGEQQDSCEQQAEPFAPTKAKAMPAESSIEATIAKDLFLMM